MLMRKSTIPLAMFEHGTQHRNSQSHNSHVETVRAKENIKHISTRSHTSPTQMDENHSATGEKNIDLFSSFRGGFH